MKIKDLFHFEKGSLQSTKATPGNYDFITAAADWKTHYVFTHDCEALIFAAAASGSLGRTHYVNGKFISSDLCFIITPKNQGKYPVDLKFYHLLFLAFKDEIVRNTKSGTSKESIGLTVFGKYELPYFDIDKQIETRLKFVKAQESTNKIDFELTLQVDLIKQLRQAFLQEAMQGKLTNEWRASHPELVSGSHSAEHLLSQIKAEKARLIKEKKIKKQKPLPPITQEKIPFEIPENWAWCRLGEVTQSMTNGIYKEEKYYSDDGVGCFRMYNISDGKINFDKLKRMLLTVEEIERYLLTQNDLLLNRVNSIELLGKSGLLPYLDEPFVFESKNIRVILFEKSIIAPYVNYLFLTPLIKDQILKSFKKVTGQASISQEKLNPLLIPLPPLTEQQRIVAKLDELMRYCDELEASIKASQQQNELLLQQVLREALEPDTNECLVDKFKLEFNRKE